MIAQFTWRLWLLKIFQEIVVLKGKLPWVPVYFHGEKNFICDIVAFCLFAWATQNLFAFLLCILKTSKKNLFMAILLTRTFTAFAWVDASLLLTKTIDI